MTSKARGLANLGNAYDDGALSNRNLIINGAMQVAQRGTSTTSDAGFAADRFINFQNIGTFTAEQSTDAPDGYSYSLKRTNGTGVTAATSDYSLIRHNLEGYNVSHLGQSTSGAKAVTISFWVKSSLTGTYIVALSDANDLVQYPASYTVNSANTWEKKEVTIEGYTGGSGSWSTTNGIGLKVHWDLGSGPNRQVSTLNAWNTSPAGAWSHSSRANWVGTTGATFYITGVQLEVGDTATPFEHRSYGDELARCQRYYQAYVTGSVGNQSFGSLTNWDGGSGYGGYLYPQRMRVPPSASHIGGLGTFYGNGAQTRAVNGFYPQNMGVDGLELQIAFNSGFTSTNGWWRLATNFELRLDAEL